MEKNYVENGNILSRFYFLPSETLISTNTVFIFADYGTVWRTGSDIKRLAEEIEVDLKKCRLDQKVESEDKC